MQVGVGVINGSNVNPRCPKMLGQSGISGDHSHALTTKIENAANEIFSAQQAFAMARVLADRDHSRPRRRRLVLHRVRQRFDHPRFELRATGFEHGDGGDWLLQRFG